MFPLIIFQLLSHFDKTCVELCVVDTLAILGLKLIYYILYVLYRKYIVFKLMHVHVYYLCAFRYANYNLLVLVNRASGELIT